MGDRRFSFKFEAGAAPQADVAQVLPCVTAKYDKFQQDKSVNHLSGVYLDMEQVNFACCSSLYAQNPAEPEMELRVLQKSVTERVALGVDLKQHAQDLRRVQVTTKERVIVPSETAYRKIRLRDICLLDRKRSNPKNLQQKANIRRPSVNFLFREIGSEEPRDKLKELTMKYYTQLKGRVIKPQLELPRYSTAQSSKSVAKLESLDTLQSTRQPQQTQAYVSPQWQQWQPQQSTYTPVKIMRPSSTAPTADRSTYPSGGFQSYGMSNPNWQPSPQLHDSIFR